MLCSPNNLIEVSGEAPQEPVVSLKSGCVFEKRLIEKHIKEYGKDPTSGAELTLDDLLPLKSSATVAPRVPALASIPSLLVAFQNEWDAAALERFSLKVQLERTREELSTALYQLDAATRVIERLARERDEAREALSNFTVSAGVSSLDRAGDDAMALDNEALPKEMVELVEETQARLSKSRKRRPVPEGWVTAETVANFKAKTSEPLPVKRASTAAIDNERAAIAGLQGDIAIYSVDTSVVERTLKVDDPVTDALWAVGGKVLFLATAKGSIKMFEAGHEVASFAEHAGAVTAISLHPSGKILASVGADRSIVFYNVVDTARISRVYTDSHITTGSFHPDGHIFGAGTTSGEIKLLMTSTGEQAATFSLGAPIQALVFSENGYLFAATAKGQTTVTIFDLRKKGDAAQVKVLDVGGVVESLDWDYTGQFLATAGASGITVQQYTKSSKTWSEPLRTAIAASCVRWCQQAKKLLAVGHDGVATLLEAPEE